MQKKKSDNKRSFNPQSLLANAINSITIGADDFIASRGNDDNSVRALSAARNFYSGMLLLFKYRIAISTADLDKSEEMIYLPDKILPYLNENGKIEWRPFKLKKDKTIDYIDIKYRFESLGIATDWDAVDKLRKCRNELEHFSSEHSMVEIGRFVANLYPILHKFIAQEIKKAPADLLGSAWTSMMKHHDFQKQTVEDIKTRWENAGLPDNAANLLQECNCDACYSNLLTPNRQDLESGVSIESSEFRYECMECHHSDSLSEALENNLSLAQENNNFYEESTIVECDCCSFKLFSMLDGVCHWCNHVRKIYRCGHCSRYLTDIESRFSTTCDSCSRDEYEYQMYISTLKK